MARYSVVLCSLVVLTFLMISTPGAEGAITCGMVASGISPCINYIRGKGPLVPGCCSGIRKLVASAATTADRRAACGCLKSLAARIPDVNYGIASGLPGKCGTSVSYPISPNTDCTRVN